MTTTLYRDGFQYVNDALQFSPTSEGYVNVIQDRFNYVYNYTDHLGNIRLSFLKDPVKGTIGILEENNYYPFGLKHENYNAQKLKLERSDDGVSIVLRPTVRNIYQYKYQGQERQDELGLNWDSFKWRNYDYAIGRFMSIDPLAEKYAYNSIYAFQENKMGLGRELEGLEMTSERSKDGKSITLTINAKAVNKTQGTLTTKQYEVLLAARIANTEKVLSGSMPDNTNVTAKVVINPKATLTMEFNTGIDVSTVKSLKGASKEKIDATEALAVGITDEGGNTQINKTQVNVSKMEFDSFGMPVFDKSNIDDVSRWGTHEDLHQALGNGHVDPGTPNIMNREDLGNNTITPEQRKNIIDTVEKQQSN